MDQQATDALQAAIALYKQGRLEQAGSMARTALQFAPDSFTAHQLLGMIAARSGNSLQAIGHFDDALKVDPASAETLYNRGVALSDGGRYAEALSSYDKALSLKPRFAEAFNNRGETLSNLARHQEALASFEAALKIRPDYAAALNNRGGELMELHRFDDALASFDSALEASPGYVQALNNRGLALYELGRSDEALASYDEALRIKPGYAEACNNRGIALKYLNRFDDALASFDRALEIRPGFAEAHNNRGMVLKDLRRFDEALDCYHRAQQISPDYAEAHWNEGLCRLLNGEFGEGWRKYEWRWKRKSQREFLRQFEQPLWLGAEDIRDRTILLHAEQGFGDTIQFCRFARDVTRLGAHVILEVPRQLYPLLQGLDGVAKLVQRGDQLPAFDYHCPLLSLLLALGTAANDISGKPYLQADPDKLAAWSARLGTSGRRRIGVAWSGNSRHVNDHNRSIELDEFRTILTGDDEYYCLQKDIRTRDEPALKSVRNLHIVGDDLSGFDDTAALVALMDLVITVDTSLAHLAGALGKEVWILIPDSPDWRWLLDRRDTPWYDSATLFRQSRAGNWTDVLENVQLSLLDRNHTGHRQETTDMDS